MASARFPVYSGPREDASSRESQSSSSNANTASCKNLTEDYSFPKKNQAIFLDAVDGLTLKDYAVAIGGIIGPLNILFMSRISNNRICLFLKTHEIVESLLEKETKVQIGVHTLTIKPMYPKAKRVTLSSFFPITPHSVLKDKIESIELEKKKKQKQKAIITDQNTRNTEITLQPAKKHIDENEGHYPLNYEELKSFLELTHGQPGPVYISKQFSKDTQGVINMIKSIYGFLSDKGIKSRITRLAKRMEKQLKGNDSTITDLNSTGRNKINQLKSK